MGPCPIWAKDGFTIGIGTLQALTDAECVAASFWSVDAFGLACQQGPVGKRFGPWLIRSRLVKKPGEGRPMLIGEGAREFFKIQHEFHHSCPHLA